MNKMNAEFLRRINLESIRSAGPRYTPSLDAESPNLRISDLDDALVGLIGGSDFRSVIEPIHSNLLSKWEQTRKAVDSQYQSRLRKPRGCLNSLQGVMAAKLGEGARFQRSGVASVKRLISGVDSVEANLHSRDRDRRDELDRAPNSDATQSERHYGDGELNSISNQLRALHDYYSALREAQSFLHSSTCDLQHKNCVTLLGEWGSGKTHYLCDIALRRTSEGRPALILLAKDFEPVPTVAHGLVAKLSVARTLASFLNKLAKMSEHGERALLIIDGINESDVDQWRASVRELVNEVKRRPKVGLILSCRSPVQLKAIPGDLRRQITYLRHHGFNDIEFDAQREFFRYYEIPLPEVPLLADEFSRPLTLKILCEAFKELPEKAQKAGFAGLSSGQKGMTFILEKFIKRRARDIESQLNLTGGFTWSLMKGDRRFSDTNLAGIAPYMAAAGDNFVPKSAAMQMIRARPQLADPEVSTRYFQKLLAEGLLIEYEMWRPAEEGGPLPIVSFPYERFGDHIVARYILDKFLDSRNEASIRRSFFKGKVLGEIFRSERNFSESYRREGLAQALIIEFPERVKRVVPEETRELYFYLPKTRRSIRSYTEPFTHGLFWRHPDSICAQTDQITDRILSSGNVSSTRELLDALVAVATKPQHPYSGVRLFDVVGSWPLVARDIIWSEYVRKKYQDAAIHRFVIWLEESEIPNLKDDQVINLVAILSLSLTTTDQLFRNSVTRLLVRIGEKSPVAVLKRTLESLSFDDPYVPERMLAVSYGVTMSLWTDAGKRKFRSFLPSFSKELVRRMFLPGGSDTTPHVLAREYAVGIIELSRKLDNHCIPYQWVQFVRPPFAGQVGKFPHPRNIQNSVAADVSSAMRMDFENYTLGRLVKGRSNYDMQNSEYLKVKKQVGWRVRNLGYRTSFFQDIDQEIGRFGSWGGQDSEGKVDRYGKKYSMIAYFELYGIRQAQNEISEYRIGERCSDCDIDPSFTLPPPALTIKARDVFSGQPASPKLWLKTGPVPNHDNLLEFQSINDVRGPWILLDGFVRQVDDRSDRAADTHLKGLFVENEQVQNLRRGFRKESQPGSGMPHQDQNYLIFAGEIGWSKTVGSHIRLSNGRLRPGLQERAFESFETKHVTKRVKKAWILATQDLGYVPTVEPIRFVEVASGESNKTDEEDRQWAAIEAANSQVSANNKIDLSDLLSDIPTKEEVSSGYRQIDVRITVPGVPVTPTSSHFGFEANSSISDVFSRFEFPCAALCDEFGLASAYRKVDLVDKTGNPATVYRAADSTAPIQHNLLYIKKTLLDAYLRKNKLALLWTIWGERGFNHSVSPGFYQQKSVQSVLQSNVQYFKKSRLYNSKRLTR